MTCEVLSKFYVSLDWLHSLNISHRNLYQLLEEVSWINALMIEENVYPDLVKVFTSNMDISEEKKNRAITKVGGVLIDLVVSELNSILETSDYGL